MGGASAKSHTARSDTFDFALAPHLLGWRNEILIRNSGLKVSDFEMFKVIGISMFGWVRLAKHKSSGNYVACKCMRKSEVIRLNQVKYMQVDSIVSRLLVNVLITVEFCFEDGSRNHETSQPSFHRSLVKEISILQLFQLFITIGSR